MIVAFVFSVVILSFAEQKHEPKLLAVGKTQTFTFSKEDSVVLALLPVTESYNIMSGLSMRFFSSTKKVVPFVRFIYSEKDAISTALNFDYTCSNWTDGGKVPGVAEHLSPLEMQSPLKGYFCQINYKMHDFKPAYKQPDLSNFDFGDLDALAEQFGITVAVTATVDTSYSLIGILILSFTGAAFGWFFSQLTIIVDIVEIVLLSYLSLLGIQSVIYFVDMQNENWLIVSLPITILINIACYAAHKKRKGTKHAIANEVDFNIMKVERRRQVMRIIERGRIQQQKARQQRRKQLQEKIKKQQDRRNRRNEQQKKMEEYQKKQQQLNNNNGQQTNTSSQDSRYSILPVGSWFNTDDYDSSSEDSEQEYIGEDGNIHKKPKMNYEAMLRALESESSSYESDSAGGNSSNDDNDDIDNNNTNTNSKSNEKDTEQLH
ncbi:MAG: hypothetical protein EZS28_013996 [Streblomastix strix]|uniref:Uncharacterized protein n=1 Tax=Streblomastix strix TaxID=222440 RepID=A0A5J4W6J3_9EUKA|nr:MAG: hypothetical protein EZS28_013996 [Streblomastix strix]